MKFFGLDSSTKDSEVKIWNLFLHLFFVVKYERNEDDGIEIEAFVDESFFKEKNEAISCLVIKIYMAFCLHLFY